MLRFKKNGMWQPDFPNCLVKCPPLQEKPLIMSEKTIFNVQVRSLHLIYNYNINNMLIASSLQILDIRKDPILSNLKFFIL